VVEIALEIAERLKEMLEALLAAWGGAERLVERALLKKIRKQHPKLYERMLLRRNHRWLAPIEAMIYSGRSKMCWWEAVICPERKASWRS